MVPVASSAGTDDGKSAEYSDKDRIDLLVKIINRFDFYINSTNAKASLVIAWNGVIIGAVLLKYADVLEGFVDGSRLEWWMGAMLFVIALLAAISNLIVMWVVFPFLTFTSSESKKSRVFVDESIFFFGSLAKLDAESFHRKISKIGETEILKDVSDQAVTIAKGLDGKMNKIRASIYFVVTQIVLLVILTFITIFFT